MAEAKSICVVPACERPIKNRKLGYCDPHYKRYWRHGDVQAHIPLSEPRRAPIAPIDHPDGTRTCGECFQRMPLTQGFHKDARAHLGHRPTCKRCRVARETERYNADPEAARLRIRQYRQDNLQHVRDREAAYYEKNRAKRIETATAQSHIRRARVMSARTDKGITVSRLRAIHGDTCYYCGVTMAFGVWPKGKRPRNRATLEHLTPISRGGTHTWDNCRLSCWACNISKGARDYPNRLMLRTE